MVIKVGDKWCKATTTWKFWWNFLAKSLFFSRYPSFSPFECPDAYKCYTFSESYGSRETREIKISTSKFDLEAQGILSPLWTQTGPWSDTASYQNIDTLSFDKKDFEEFRIETRLKIVLRRWWWWRTRWQWRRSCLSPLCVYADTVGWLVPPKEWPATKTQRWSHFSMGYKDYDHNDYHWNYNQLIISPSLGFMIIIITEIELSFLPHWSRSSVFGVTIFIMILIKDDGKVHREVLPGWQPAGNWSCPPTRPTTTTTRHRWSWWWWQTLQV